MKQIIGITGGTGFVGGHLCTLLLKEGFDVVIFTRHPESHSGKQGLKYALWNPAEKQCDEAAFQNLNGMVHLAGAGVADKRWTDERKKTIVKSRVEGTLFLVENLKKYAPDCKVLVSASAIGFYGPDRENADIPFKEDAAPYDDFLAKTCIQWEASSNDAASFLRRVVLRFGIVLGSDGGAFSAFAKPQSFGIVPILGSGKQMVSWIHVGDLSRIILWALKEEKAEGIFNTVAPKPVSHKALMEAIAKEKGGIKIPVYVPALFLKMGFGEMAQEVLKSCTVSDEKLRRSGFEFHFPEIRKAVRNILKKW